MGEGRVVFVTRYEVIVHARNVNAHFGSHVVIYANSRDEAVEKAVAVGCSGDQRDARVSFQRVTQEPIVIPPSPTNDSPRERAAETNEEGL